MKDKRELELNRIKGILDYLDEDSMVSVRFEIERILDKQTDKEDNLALEVSRL